MQLWGKKDGKNEKSDDMSVQSEISKRNLKSLTKNKDNENINLDPQNIQNDVKIEILGFKTLKSSCDGEPRSRPTLRNTVRFCI